MMATSQPGRNADAWLLASASAPPPRYPTRSILQSAAWRQPAEKTVGTPAGASTNRVPFSDHSPERRLGPHRNQDIRLRKNFKASQQAAATTYSNRRWGSGPRWRWRPDIIRHDEACCFMALRRERAAGLFRPPRVESARTLWSGRRRSLSTSPATSDPRTSSRRAP